MPPGTARNRYLTTGIDTFYEGLKYGNIQDRFAA
jgi:hypothetical protein